LDWEGACALLTRVPPAIRIEKLRPEHCSTAAGTFAPKFANRTALYAKHVWPWLMLAARERACMRCGRRARFAHVGPRGGEVRERAPPGPPPPPPGPPHK
jgi:hypothetical protein